MNTTKTTKQDLIEAINIMLDSSNLAADALLGRWETLNHQKVEEAGSVALLETIVATSNRKGGKPLFTEIAHMAYLSGWDWEDFNADMKKAYVNFVELTGEDITPNLLNSRFGGCWGRFKNDPELWGEEKAPKEPEDEITAILKTLKRVHAKLEDRKLGVNAAAKIKSSLNDIQSLITIN
tara:strand:+ start:107 stop:646 length:540 start_codon:yes stop_codon:yes gene_type:complete